MRIDANRKVQDRLTYLLEQLSELCVVSGDVNGEIEPIEQNQVMLDNLGKERNSFENRYVNWNFLTFSRYRFGDSKLCSLKRK